MSLVPSSGDYKHAAPHLAFKNKTKTKNTGIVEIQLRSLCLCGKHFSGWAISQSLKRGLGDGIKKRCKRGSLEEW